MMYHVLADIIVLIHFAWIVFLVCGAWWGRKIPAVKVLHGIGIVFALISQAAGWYCPLTHLEVWLRMQHHPSQAYPGSFIAHYAEKIVYIELPPPVIMALTIALAGVNIWLYRRSAKNNTP